MGTSSTFYYAFLVSIVLSLPAKNEEHCEDDQIPCNDRSGCIYEDFICDTLHDCSDGSDEERCHDTCVVAAVDNSDLEIEIRFGHGNNRTINCARGYHYEQHEHFIVKCSQGNISGVPVVPKQCYPLTCPQNTTDFKGHELTFPETVMGEMVESLQTCGEVSVQPDLAVATRSCGIGFWDDPVLNTCPSKKDYRERIEEIANENVTEKNVEEVARELEILTTNVEVLDNYTTIERTDEILLSIVEANSPSKNVTISVVKIVDNLMNVNAERLDKQSSSNIISSLEKQISNVQRNSGNFTQVEDNIAIKAIKISPHVARNVTYLNSNLNYIKELQNESVDLLFDAKESNIAKVSASIFINKNLFEKAIKATKAKSSNSTVPFSFTLYRNASLFEAKPASDGINNIIASQVISAKVEGAPISNLPAESAVVMRFLNITADLLEDNQTINQVKCVFWVFPERNEVGYWSDRGCNTTYDVEQNQTVCTCNHLTCFAVLVGVGTIPDDFNRFLTFVSWIGSLLSVIGLSACILLLLLVKELRAKRVTKIHINLILTLVAFYTTFLASGVLSSKRHGNHCKNIAAAVHYFCLATVCWMSVEAVSLYFLFVKYQRSISRYFLPSACVLAYGFPIIPVIITRVVKTKDDDHDYCFLPKGNSLYYGLLLEVFLLVALNIITFATVVRKVVFRKFLSTKAQRNKKTEVISRIQQFVMFWVLLGLSWIFGLLSFVTDGKTYVCEILFCLFTSLQGFILFIFICVKNPEVKKAIVKARETLTTRGEYQMDTLSS